MTFKSVLRIFAYWKHFLGIFVPIVLLPIPLIYQTKTASCAYCVLILAIFWMTEAIPIPVTAILPVVLYPLLGISDTDTISREYLKDSIMVFVGGLLVALAFEFCNLHKRIALRVMLATGASLTMLMLGTMLTTGFLSMWMFNTENASNLTWNLSGFEKKTLSFRRMSPQFKCSRNNFESLFYVRGFFLLSLGHIKCNPGLITATTAMMVPIIQAVLDELQRSLEEVYSEENEGVSKSNLPEIEEIPQEEQPKSSFYEESIQMTELTLTPRETSRRKNLAAETQHVNKIQSKPSSYNSHQFPAQERKKGNKIVFVDQQDKESSCNKNSDEKKVDKKDQVTECIRNMRTMFLLSTCYSSNIGGTGVITGSGTNLVALEFLGDLDPKHHGDYASLTFATWAAFNFLPMTLNIIVAWVYLQLVFLGFPIKLKLWKSGLEREKEVANQIFHPELESKIRIMLERKYKDLGGITFHEIGVAICFVTAVTSWVLHEPKFIPGWSELFYGGPKVSISTATLAIGILFFIVPRNADFYRACATGDFGNTEMKPLLEWEFVQRRFPWGVIILLGGGYALSKGAKAAGLNELIGQSLKSLAHLSPSMIQLCCMGMIAFITEVTSNTATASIVIPILLELSKGLNIHPLYLTLPATVTCSYAFMLPVATPPNAIVYSAGNMNVMDMIKTGLFMNIACVLILYATTNLYGNLFFHFTEYNYIP